MTSKITTRKTYVKICMTSTHKRTLTERHTEYNNTNTMCRSCTRLHPPPPPPPLPAQSPPPGELVKSNISQRLPRVELTNHLSRAFPIPLLNDCQRPHWWNTRRKLSNFVLFWLDWRLLDLIRRLAVDSAFYKLLYFRCLTLLVQCSTWAGMCLRVCVSMPQLLKP